MEGVAAGLLFRRVDPALQTLIDKGLLRKGNTAVIIDSISVGEQIVDAVQMRVVS